MRLSTAPLLCCTILIGGLGVAHGIYSDRWGPSNKLERSVEALSRIPATIDDWTGEDLPFDPSEMAHAGIERAVVRRYHNPRTRETVTLLIVCGRGGPICVHTPDVCYAGNGYAKVGEEKSESFEFPGQSDSFRIIQFEKRDSLAANQLEIYWGWSRDGRSWEAPENPRLALARSASLFKMYVIREFIPGPRSNNHHPCKAFLQRALPVLAEKLRDSRS